jgi:sulfoxide reductase heme-binding subunit YedZ
MAPKLINMRRILGVAAFCYAALHLTLYFVQEKFDLLKIVSEIALRFYLTIGFVALCGLIALAATSTDGMIKRLGGERWNRLHKIIYVIAILGIIHFMLQTKIDITESVMAAGFLIWLLGYRLMHRTIGAVSYRAQIVLAISASALTAFAEAAWYGATTGVMWTRVLSANLDWDIGSLSFRPAHWVLIVGLGVTLASFLWSLRPQRPKARKTSARAPSGAIQPQSAS